MSNSNPWLKAFEENFGPKPVPEGWSTYEQLKKTSGLGARKLRKLLKLRSKVEMKTFDCVRLNRFGKPRKLPVPHYRIKEP
jgi:hypothetical protein